MSIKNPQLFEQILTVLTAVERPISKDDLSEHQMIKAMEVSPRTLASALTYLRKHGKVDRIGDNLKTAKYRLHAGGKPREAKVPMKTVEVVCVRVHPDGRFHSVQTVSPVTFEVVV
jgi:hypothetical protein